MEGDPFAVVEGMTIAGFATGSERGYLYVRGEYPVATRRMGLAIAAARAAGLLGGDVMNAGFAFDIERKNVYVPESGITFNIAGKIESRGFEVAAAVSPIEGLKLWGNAAFVHSRFVDFSYVDGNGDFQSYSGMTPPNTPTFVGNVGASYRFATPWPVEIGGLVRHVGDRFNFQDNLVTMDNYTIADAYAFVDLPKWVFNSVERTRLMFRVKNLTDRRYAAWGDPGYTDQIILGAPRSYEVAASFKW